MPYLVTIAAIATNLFRKKNTAISLAALACSDACLFYVALVFLLQHNYPLQLASMGSLVLVANYNIATHLLLPEVQLHRTQRVAIRKILRCKVLYCYTLVVVAIGEAPLLPQKCFGCYMWFPLLPRS